MKASRTTGSADFLAGGGEMGAFMRARDWTTTPLGSSDAWPQSLRTAVSILLNSRYPMFIAWGPKLAFLYNDGYRPIFGVKHPQALGQPFAEIWAEIWDDIAPLVDRALSGEATWSDDLRLFMERRGYPEEVYFTFSYSPIRDETGGVGGMFCACTETTGTVLGERRLRCLRDLAAVAAEAKTVEDAERLCFRVLESNPGDIPFALLYRLAGGSSAQLVQSAGVRPGAPAARQSFARGFGAWPLTRVARGEIETVTDLPARFSEVPCSIWGDPIRTALILPVCDRAQTEVHAALVLGVSPRRELDDDYGSFLELVASNLATAVANAQAFESEHQRAEALAALDRAKTAFFSNVSHEFRTPLTLMLGPLEETLRNPWLAGADREQLTIAHRNGLRLLKLVNTLLDFSRVEADRARAVYHATDLAAVTADFASSFRSACERAGLPLIVDCPPLPQPVYVDPDLWEKIVLNLVSNAFKFTFEGEIAVTVRARGDHAELTVRDTGIGIPDEELPRIFDRFHRVADARGRSHEGSGIGLALVRELVGLHGGTVQVASTAGQGTTFTVRVPFGTAHLPTDRVGAPRTPASTATRAEAYVEEALRWLPGPADLIGGSDPLDPVATVEPEGGRSRVLLADDNADMRDYLRRLLSTRYRVQAFEDGQAALEAAKASRPDLILADVMMPRLDGFGLLKGIRADPELSGVPVVLLSARAGDEAQVEGLEAGADDYLIKPFSARELVARIETNLETARLRRRNEAQLQLVIDELNHRVKNTLATVQSIAAQTLRGAPVADALREAIDARLIALSRSHELLTRENWERASLRDVAFHALEPFGIRDGASDRFSIEGDGLRLRPKTVLALGMAFHELATNAVKYGALSEPGGHVELAWVLEGESLRLRWMERGGPPVAPPSRKGFGSRLIERGLTHELGGAVRLDYQAEGVVCEIEMPMPARGGGDR